jgi:hypothetical protein
MLTRLLKLYSKVNSNTPVEDFTTEVFASILETDEEILNIFISEILDLNFDDFQIETQKNYTLNSGERAIIDIVLKSQNIICFIENKVESCEGLNQLDKYSKVLDSLPEYKERYLFYCTKYFDPKEETRHRFRQFRWFNIAKIIKSSENNLAKEFYNFLKSNNMTQRDEISTRDLFNLENIKETLNFLDSFLERIQPTFKEIFGKHASLDNTSQMRRFNRYVFYKANVFGSEKGNEIGVGFKFDNEPKAYIWIWTSASNSKAPRFNEYLTEFGDTFDDYEKDYCSYSTELITFLGKENSLLELENWYRDKFLKLKSFIDQTKDLEWKLE